MLRFAVFYNRQFRCEGLVDKVDDVDDCLNSLFRGCYLSRSLSIGGMFRLQARAFRFIAVEAV